jgi:hypothetical protein
MVGASFYLLVIDSALSWPLQISDLLASIRQIIAISIELAFHKEKEYKATNLSLNLAIKTVKDDSVQNQIYHHK